MPLLDVRPILCDGETCDCKQKKHPEKLGAIVEGVLVIHDRRHGMVHQAKVSRKELDKLIITS